MFLGVGPLGNLQTGPLDQVRADHRPRADGGVRCPAGAGQRPDIGRSGLVRLTSQSAWSVTDQHGPPETSNGHPMLRLEQQAEGLEALRHQTLSTLERFKNRSKHTRETTRTGHGRRDILMGERRTLAANSLIVPGAGRAVVTVNINTVLSNEIWNR